MLAFGKMFLPQPADFTQQMAAGIAPGLGLTFLVVFSILALLVLGVGPLVAHGVHIQPPPKCDLLCPRRGQRDFAVIHLPPL